MPEPGTGRQAGGGLAASAAFSIPAKRHLRLASTCSVLQTPHRKMRRLMGRIFRRSAGPQ